MKSMLHEASSVAKAIEQAWVESGKPGEFTINVLEPGEKGFLGIMTKRPAIVSITYDPRKLSQRPDRLNGQQDRKNAQQRRQERFDDRKSGRQQQGNVSLQKEHKSHARDQKAPQRNVSQEVERVSRQQERQQAPAHQRQERAERGSFQADVWTPELAGQIKPWLQEICSLMGINVPFQTEIDKKVLYVNFQDRIFSADDERALYMSLAYLLMQFLKKTHKKKFHNCHIVISTKGSGGHDKPTGNIQE